MPPAAKPATRPPRKPAPIAPASRPPTTPGTSPGRSAIANATEPGADSGALLDLRREGRGAGLRPGPRGCRGDRVGDHGGTVADRLLDAARDERLAGEPVAVTDLDIRGEDHRIGGRDRLGGQR